MKYMVLTACLTASPAFAYDAMTAQSCQDSWDTLAQSFTVFGAFTSDPKSANVAIGAGGWCMIDASPSGLSMATDLPAVGFKIESAESFLAGDGLPEAIAVRLEALSIGERQYDAEAHLRHLPDTGQLVFENVTLRHDDDSGISASFIMQGAFFSDMAGLQTSLAGLRMTELHGQAAVSQSLLDDLDIDLSEVNRVSMGEALRDVSRFQVNTATRQAFLGMISDREGELDVDITSERGFGWIQAVVPFLNVSDDKDVASALGVAMTGVTIALEWEQGDI
jgi:hypothetical protein